MDLDKIINLEKYPINDVGSLKYKKLTNEELDKSIIVFLMCQIMRDKQLRPFSIKTVDDVYNNKKKNFFKEFQTFLTTQNKALLDAQPLQNNY